ncbi:MAG: peptidylprolyl isomerase [Dehalococcoidia bacterium]
MFYVAFIVVMILSLAAVGLAPGLGSTTSGGGAPIIEDSPVPGETPTGLMTFGKAEDTIDTSKAQKAVITTDRGPIVIALNPDAPQAVNSFAFLAGYNFYDGLEFFWVLPQFTTQAGDPTCEASGVYSCAGTAGPGYDIPREGDSADAGQWSVFLPVTSRGSDLVHGSQFVIALADEAKIEGSVIGEVIEGREILESLEQRVPCFGSQPSESNPCQTPEELPPPLIIEDVVVQPA